MLPEGLGCSIATQGRSGTAPTHAAAVYLETDRLPARHAVHNQRQRLVQSDSGHTEETTAGRRAEVSACGFLPWKEAVPEGEAPPGPRGSARRVSVRVRPTVRGQPGADFLS